MRWLDCYYRDTWVEVNLQAIENNIARIKNLFQHDVKVMAIVKANAYGHGAYEVAKTALQAGAGYLAVAFIDEAIMLREEGIDAPILILGYTRPEDVPVALKYQLTLTAFQTDWLIEAQKFFMDKTDKLHIHIKYDTGMGRIGIASEGEAEAFLQALKAIPNFIVEGVYTHFATADERETDYFQKQYGRFLSFLEQLEKRQIRPTYVHCANSAAGMRFPDRCFNMIRLGISMYGLSPSLEIKDELPVPLEEAFSLKTKIIHVKHVPPGEGISYGRTYVTKDWEWIATLPIGYADGWLRYHAANGGYALVNGKKAPFVGRICMDQCMIRLPEKAAVGTTVTLIGKDKEEYISIDDVAKRLSTINYEIPCMISQRVPRIYFYNNEKISVRNDLCKG